MSTIHPITGESSPTRLSAGNLVPFRELAESAHEAGPVDALSKGEPLEKLLLGIVRMQYEQQELLHRVAADVLELKSRILHQTKAVYSVDELAELTDRSPYSVRRWIKAGQLYAFRAPGSGNNGPWIIPREALKELRARGLGDELPELLVGEDDATSEK